MPSTLTRREMLKATGMGALALAMGGGAGMTAAAAEHGGRPAEYTQSALPYAYDALEPVLTEQILQVHHGRHHAGYVRGLNATLEKLEQARAEGDMAGIRALSRDLAFHGSGHVLHEEYWRSMAPGGSAEPSGAFRQAIDRDFGSLAALKAQYAAAAKAVESNGWCLLGYEPLGQRLLVFQVEKHQNLTIWGAAPLLVCDVWEHAYYLQYKNDRGSYVDGFVEIANWAYAQRRFGEVAA